MTNTKTPTLAQWLLSPKEEKRRLYLVEASKRWRDNHPDRAKAHRAKYGALLKLNVMRIVSKSPTPRCIYCGCDDMRALEVNHKNGGGRKEIKDKVRNGTSLYNEIDKGRRSVDDLEVTCRPCNNIHYLRTKYGPEINRWEIRWRGY